MNKFCSSGIIKHISNFIYVSYLKVCRFAHIFIWASIESALSNTIPKLRALEEARISEDAIWRLFVLGLDWWYLEVITRNSVLSSFSFNLLTVIHNFMSLIHDTIFARESFSSLSSFKSKDRYSYRYNDIEARRDEVVALFDLAKAFDKVPLDSFSKSLVIWAFMISFCLGLVPTLQIGTNVLWSMVLPLNLFLFFLGSPRVLSWVHFFS